MALVNGKLEGEPGIIMVVQKIEEATEGIFALFQSQIRIYAVFTLASAILVKPWFLSQTA